MVTLMAANATTREGGNFDLVEAANMWTVLVHGACLNSAVESNLLGPSRSVAFCWDGPMECLGSLRHAKTRTEVRLDRTLCKPR